MAKIGIGKTNLTIFNGEEDLSLWWTTICNVADDRFPHGGSLAFAVVGSA